VEEDQESPRAVRDIKMHFEDPGAMGGGSTEFENVQTESLDLYATGRPFKT
jgi:hypothetical protein